MPYRRTYRSLSRPVRARGSFAQNCADLSGSFKQFCRFILDDSDILFFGNVRIADVHQLHDLSSAMMLVASAITSKTRILPEATIS